MSTVRKFSLTFVTLLALVALIVVWSESRSRKAHKELKAAFERIQLGVSSSELQALIGESEFRYLKLQQVDSNNFRVLTPLVWGAHNWVLWIEVTNDKVATLRIRFFDDRRRRPDQAPPDKGGG